MKDIIEAATGADVSRETLALLEQYVALLLKENARQNLIARSTTHEIWQRHIADSAQLVRFAPRPDSSWLDIGSGAGLPGMVIAILAQGPVTLVEPRKLRADFLTCAAKTLGLDGRVKVHAAKAERITGRDGRFRHGHLPHDPAGYGRRNGPHHPPFYRTRTTFCRARRAAPRWPPEWPTPWRLPSPPRAGELGR